MFFTYRQLSSERWGIYSDSRLLATIGDQSTLEIILVRLTKKHGSLTRF